jgi:hypothetical protein
MEIKFNNPSKIINSIFFASIVKKIDNKILIIECETHHMRPSYELKYIDKPDSFELALDCCCPDFSKKIEEIIGKVIKS